MKSMRMHLIAVAAVTLLLASVALGHAQGVKTFATLPFEVNGPDKYAHLRQGVQSMLAARLTWPDRFVPVDREKLADVKVSPKSAAQAKDVLAKTGADYLVWGSVTIVGDDASLDVQAMDRDGKTWPKSAQSKISDLIPTLERTAKEMNAEIFKRPDSVAEKQAEQKKQVAGMNPSLVYNETNSERDYTLNPEIVYEGGAETPGRWRSQSFPWTGVSMAVGDVNGDKRNDVVILGERSLHVFAFSPQGLTPIAELALPKQVEPIKVNLFDVDRDGVMEIVFTGTKDMEPFTAIYKCSGNQLTAYAERIPMYMNVVKVPPNYVSTLVGQRKGRAKFFDNNDVREVVRLQDGRFELGAPLNLPDHANIYNIGFIPEDNDYKTLIVDSSDHIRVHTSQNRLLATTDETYAGSATSVTWYSNKPGTGMNAVDKFAIEETYYVPLRMIASDLERDGKWEILVNRNISVAAQFFERYRFFPQGEIQALVWDGVGMQLLWKTRPIKGSVADYGLADVTNNGKQDLWVLVNSHPGAVGAGTRRATVLTYSLETDTVKKEAKPAKKP